ncbi:MAG TPA: DNA translocase FtsK 4TM domain-containing protein, partial [Novosphingobium sp.]|nr:DNA translocase FtsK 4TM domain-containing protein [Novosphingobium sp.]
MATRPATASHRGARVDWRAAMKRALRRSAEIGGAMVLLAAMVFLALALMSYHQTDPSASTAAAGPAKNWMGGAGAWAAERALFLFGWVSVLLLPMLYVMARKLWRLVEEEDGELAHADHAWWRPVGLLLFAMTLIATPVSLVIERQSDFPAGWGGIAGLLGAGGIGFVSAKLPEGFQWVFTFGAGLLSLAVGALIAGRVFAIDWGSLFTLPGFLKRRPALPDRVVEAIPAIKARKERAAPPVPLGEPRKAPEITDPSRPAKPAQLSGKSRQGDLFDAYELPALDLLNDPPPNTAQKIDKLGLERNARLLETVLDDFNVKGEITAVRTGPVVTMYELEPAPGIKASRVVGLADDIARNMSAISARVSPIPGRTVMGIELPNADRQMVSFKELVACEKFAASKGALPIILGKDIAGEPIVADLATMPHLLVAGTTGSGKSVGLNCILLSLLYRLTPAECRLILVDPKVLELKSYDDIPHLLSPVVTEPAKAV